MAKDKKELKWGNVREDMAERIFSQAEKFLDSQLKVAIESDKKAISTSSILTGFATAIIGGGFAFFANSKSGGVQLLLSAITAGGLLYLASCVAFWAARPVNFYFPGAYPNDWWPCRKAKLNDALIGEAQNYQERIEHNEKQIDSSAAALLRATKIALCAPIAGVLVLGITYFFCPA